MNIPVFAFILLAFLAPDAYADGDSVKGTTFYGEHCDLCGDYGYCNRRVTFEEAVHALRAHYSKRGLRVLILRQKERFLEAEIYNEGTRVDRVLLDLKTGRIRSMY